mmetsp:Transcript_45760/g.115186  ORF Transcript_45760/g.115186 Transcript_45760/m.115186 type:complete len:636 (+) Transcript_45760:380-2287(+)|eukprot:CAMPEP_0177651726 /NCGR_PEP_ID=MMETSP0447-20121125/12715_1 /TAXON_ID=0 /ORGANISM="Stygamoeba regulata, Strain BSH-02190019" /LENGTH=635 /DNA_ID=CAMNT_0019154853 /DNA_START=330 /DNA_END=2237 /DNA_ORIENTATION=+
MFWQKKTKGSTTPTKGGSIGKKGLGARQVSIGEVREQLADPPKSARGSGDKHDKHDHHHKDHHKERERKEKEKEQPHPSGKDKGEEVPVNGVTTVDKNKASEGESSAVSFDAPPDDAPATNPERQERDSDDRRVAHFAAAAPPPQTSTQAVQAPATPQTPTSKKNAVGDLEGLKPHDHVRALKSASNLYADMFITTDGGKNRLPCHVCILCARCPLVNELITGKKPGVKFKGRQVLLETYMNEDVSNTMQHLLTYFYVGKVDFKNIPMLEVLDIVVHCRRYKVERLLVQAENYLLKSLKLDNVFDLLTAAHQVKELRCKNFCVDFIVNNYVDALLRKDDVYKLGVELFHDVVSQRERAMSPTGVMIPDANSLLAERVYQTRGEPPEDTMLDDFEAMFKKMEHTDAVVHLCGNIPFHRGLLASSSQRLITSMNTARAEDCTNELLLTDATKTTQARVVYLHMPTDVFKYPQFRLSAQAFTSILEHVYYGSRNIDPLDACSIIPFCHFFDLVDLQLVCEDILHKSFSPQNILPIIGTTYAPIGPMSDMEQLRFDATRYIVENIKDVNLAPLNEDAADARKQAVHRDVVCDLLEAFQDNLLSRPIKRTYQSQQLDVMKQLTTTDLRGSIRKKEKAGFH